ncbi:hypothetical protein BDW62DRAFT_176794 [Aspergillus aurantiobrunneus]
MNRDLPLKKCNHHPLSGYSCHDVSDLDATQCCGRFWRGSLLSSNVGRLRVQSLMASCASQTTQRRRRD